MTTTFKDLTYDVVSVIFDFINHESDTNHESLARIVRIFLRVGDATMRRVALVESKSLSPRIRAIVVHERLDSSVSATLAESMGILPLDVVVRSKKDGNGYVHLNVADVLRSLGDSEYDLLSRKLNSVLSRGRNSRYDAMRNSRFSNSYDVELA